MKPHMLLRIFPASVPLGLAIVAVLAGTAGLPVVRAQMSQSPRELTLTVGKSLIVDSKVDIERVSVGFGDIAEARVVSPREVLIDGKAPGETSLIIWQTGGNKLFFDVAVRPNTTPARTKLENVRRAIGAQLPGQKIDVSAADDNIFLTGTVKDMVSAERAAAIGATAGKVVNLLYVDVPSTDPQILLKVQFATVDQSASTELGLNLISTGATNTLGRVTTGQFQPPTLTVPPNQPPTITLSEALNVFLFRPDLDLAATIRALKTRGLFEILAEPNLLAINGKQASFLAGGEFPYPILQGGGGGIGTVTVAFREFGVRINFLPLLTPRGTIRLGVEPEVSALDFTAGLTIQGFVIPGLSTRRVQTEIELESGQAFAIGGLLDRRLTETMQKIPLLGDVPVLGKLFQSRSTDRRHNELLVIVTPEIVQPIPQGQKPPLVEYPKPLMGSDVVPRTPGTNVTGQAAPGAIQPIPLESLMRSTKAEAELKLEQRRTVSSSPGAQPYNPMSTGATSGVK